MRLNIDRWYCFSTEGERSQSAIRSWFPFGLDDDDKILMAQGYEADDGSTSKLRLLVRRANGNLVEVWRRNNHRSTKHGWNAPSADLMRRATELRLVVPDEPTEDLDRQLLALHVAKLENWSTEMARSAKAMSEMGLVDAATGNKALSEELTKAARTIMALSAAPSVPVGGWTERDKLVEQIDALLALDARGALVPHGIGGLARTCLTEAVRLLGGPNALA